MTEPSAILSAERFWERIECGDQHEDLCDLYQAALDRIAALEREYVTGYAELFRDHADTQAKLDAALAEVERLSK